MAHLRTGADVTTLDLADVVCQGMLKMHDRKMINAPLVDQSEGGGKCRT